MATDISPSISPNNFSSTFQLEIDHLGSSNARTQDGFSKSFKKYANLATTLFSKISRGQSQKISFLIREMFEITPYSSWSEGIAPIKQMERVLKGMDKKDQRDFLEESLLPAWEQFFYIQMARSSMVIQKVAIKLFFSQNNMDEGIRNFLDQAVAIFHKALVANHLKENNPDENLSSEIRFFLQELLEAIEQRGNKTKQLLLLIFYLWNENQVELIHYLKNIASLKESYFKHKFSLSEEESIGCLTKLRNIYATLKSKKRGTLILEKWPFIACSEIGEKLSNEMEKTIKTAYTDSKEKEEAEINHLRLEVANKSEHDAHQPEGVSHMKRLYLFILASLLLPQLPIFQQLISSLPSLFSKSESNAES